MRLCLLCNTHASLEKSLSMRESREVTTHAPVLSKHYACASLEDEVRLRQSRHYIAHAYFSRIHCTRQSRVSTTHACGS